MNLILFEQKADVLRLAGEDSRALHIRNTLKMSEGDELYVGVVNDVRGKAKIIKLDLDSIELEVAWESDVPPLHRLTLLAGLPRPQTARIILREAASMGFEKLLFFGAEKGESSYAQSHIWRESDCRELLKLGAAQAFNTRIPQVICYDSLDHALDEESLDAYCKMALDLYEASVSLADCAIQLPAILAIGAERGWSPAERNTLKKADFALTHMGDRVLRSETACLAAAAILLAKGGGLTPGWGQG